MKKYLITIILCFTFLAFAGEKNKTVTLNVGGMNCQNCADKIEGALKKVNGVSEAKVELDAKKATIVLASNTTTTALIKAVSDAGFSASEGELPADTQMKKKSKSGGDDCSGDCCDGEHHKGKKAEKSGKKKS